MESKFDCPEVSQTFDGTGKPLSRPELLGKGNVPRSDSVSQWRLKSQHVRTACLKQLRNHLAADYGNIRLEQQETHCFRQAFLLLQGG
jgi:hypothetical protein